jgi:small subunit ribosomal protein S1
MNTLRAFMPGSMAASNRITDYESFIGREMEVMVESWNPRYGFVVSRKKYLNKVRPYKVQPIVDELQKNPDKIYTGRVTGSTYFGVFVELDEFITGMLHKTLASDQMRQAMRDNTIEEGSEIQVYVHAVEGTRVIFSDVPLAERDAVIAKREEEEAKEMAERPQNAEQQQKPSGYAGYRPRQFGERRYNASERTQRRDEQQPRRRYNGKKEASQSDLDRLAAHFNK